MEFSRYVLALEFLSVSISASSGVQACSVPRGGDTAIYGLYTVGMCHFEGYGFQAVYSSIAYINQSFWV